MQYFYQLIDYIFLKGIHNRDSLGHVALPYIIFTQKGLSYAHYNSTSKSKFCIEYKGKVYLGYSLDRGMNNYVSIYDGDTQIGQFTKRLTVIDNLDAYFLHIKDVYASIIPVLCFFIVYYDYRKYNNSGKLANNSVEIVTSYTDSKNDGKYNPKWIAEEFGQHAADELELKLKELRDQGSVQMRKIVKLVGLFFLVISILTISLLFFIAYNQ